MRPVQRSFLRHPLSTILANPGSVRVLKELSTHGGELSPSRLVEQTRMSRPSVLALLSQLVEQGLAEELGSARSRLFRLRTAHPLVPALNALFDAENERYHAILGAVRAAAKAAGAQAAWLYGSVARGQDRPDSDVDVAVVAPPDAVPAIKSAVREALRPSEDALGFTASVVGIGTDDLIRLADVDDPWWADVVRDAVPLLGPDPASLVAKLRKDQRVSP